MTSTPSYSSPKTFVPHPVEAVITGPGVDRMLETRNGCGRPSVAPFSGLCYLGPWLMGMH